MTLHVPKKGRCPILVLSRKKGEKVVVTVGNERVEVTIVELRGDKARLGFSASPEVKIHRDEVQQAIDRASKSQEKPHAQPLTTLPPIAPGPLAAFVGG